MTIGVATPILADIAANVLKICSSVLADFSGKVLVRLYPLMEKKLVENETGPFPPHFSYSHGPMTDFLEGIDLLIYSETAVSLEALAFGIPVIYLDCGKGKMGDPIFMATHLEGKMVARSKKELEKAIDLLLFEKTETKSLGRKFVTEYFRPANKETIAEFVSPRSANHTEKNVSITRQK